MGLAGFLSTLWDRASASLQRLIECCRRSKRAISIDLYLAVGWHGVELRDLCKPEVGTAENYDYRFDAGAIPQGFPSNINTAFVS